MMLRAADLKKAVPNLLTSLRLGLACWLDVYLAGHFGAIAFPLAASALVFLTDFADGKLARRWGCASRFGTAFDISTDFFYILSFSLTLCMFGVLPWWYAAAVAYKFVEFVLTSVYLRKWHKEGHLFVFDRLGRVSAALFYAIPLAAYLSFVFLKPVYSVVNPFLLLAVAVLALVSSAQRIAQCIPNGKKRAG